MRLEEVQPPSTNTRNKLSRIGNMWDRLKFHESFDAAYYALEEMGFKLTYGMSGFVLANQLTDKDEETINKVEQTLRKGLPQGD